MSRTFFFFLGGRFPGEDISDRPLPEVTIPFWAWLFGQDPAAVSGQRFQAQAETWVVPA